MKKLRIGTKAQADMLITQSLFVPVNGKTLSIERYSSGKYAPGKYVGKEIEVSNNVHALYAARGRDSDGPYVRIMCVTE